MGRTSWNNCEARRIVLRNQTHQRMKDRGKLPAKVNKHAIFPEGDPVIGMTQPILFRFVNSVAEQSRVDYTWRLYDEPSLKSDRLPG